MPFKASGTWGGLAANLLAKEGCRIIAVSDSRCGIYNLKGLDIKSLLRHKVKTGSVRGFEDSKLITNAELLELECDILVPSALEDQIDKANASDIKAKLIIEGANGPTTAEADEILFDKGVTVIPDVLANAGGVIVSYFEWVQGKQSFFWDEAVVNDKLQDLMTNAFGEVLSISQDEKVDMRTAAYMLAIRRIAQAITLRGIYP